jgi:TonB-dependent receptor
MKRKSYHFIISLFFLLFYMTNGFTANNASLTGYVMDSQSEEALPGANVFLEGTSLGASTDIHGKYFISNIKPGTYTLVISYVGYKDKKVSITLKDGETLKEMVLLDYQTLEGEVIEVTSQAEGQMQAINQQISANSIKNVVSSTRIQQLPEANAAEAVGRLPGISLKRSGGEGNKVVIRGLSPKYSKIQINGVTMTSTGQDRSVDLGMISPYMLDGIEVSKTAMADQEADQFGGTVNFVMKEAPDQVTLNAVLQGGYNGLREEFGDYKFVLGGSKRFFGNTFGVFAQIDVERRNRSDNSMNAGYTWLDYDSMAIAQSLNLTDVSRIIKRYGATLVLDYKTPNTKVVFSNFYSGIDRGVSTVSESYQPNSMNGNLNFNASDGNYEIGIMTNALRLEQRLGNLLIDARAFYSMSNNKIPDNYKMSATEESVFGNWAVESNPVIPDLIPSKANVEIAKAYITNFDITDSQTKENELGGEINMNYDFNISDFVKLDFKFGGKYKHKNKDYDYNMIRLPNWGGRARAREVMYDYLQPLYPQDFSDASYNNPREDINFPYGPFIDRGYKNDQFMNGQFAIDNLPDVNIMRDVIDKVLSELPPGTGFESPSFFIATHDSKMNDYNGDENYWAGYIMPTFKFGKKISFIPGLRYEKNKTEYTAIRGDYVSSKWNEPWVEGINYQDTTIIRNNDFWLPMLHLKYQALEWFDIRLSYTQTISRPSYGQITPKYTIFDNSISWNNAYLKPERATNYDIYFSFYTQKLGLLTLGGFYKTIKDKIFYKGKTNLYSDSLANLYDLPDYVTGRMLNGFINNPNEASLYGFETEWQSNFWFLPGVLKGLVFRVNYTHIYSEAKYPITEQILENVPFPFPHQEVVGNLDTTYTARLLDQPSDLLNLTLGFDYKGFSIRGSVQYTSDVFRASNFYDELRVTTQALTQYDLSVRQKLPVKGLSVYVNMSNITEPIEYSLKNMGSDDYYNDKHFYGMTIDAGLRYNFK